jgi:cytochrome P450
VADDPEKEMFRHFVSTSPEHMAFGFGKHSCPGRFFAAIEVKIALCHILLKYDFKRRGDYTHCDANGLEFGCGPDGTIDDQASRGNRRKYPPWLSKECLHL